MTPKNPISGFSLVELLITLLIMGVIAAATVPSLFSTSQTGKDTTKYTTIARNTAFMMLSAYENYKTANAGSAWSTKIFSLTPYMTYLQVDTSTATRIDGPLSGTWSTGSQTCGAQFIGNNYCYHLQNGGTIWFNDAYYFGSTNSTNAIWFDFDPDSSGPAEALQFWLTFDGHIYTVKNLPTTVTTGYIFSTSTQTPTTQDASWFTGI